MVPGTVHLVDMQGTSGLKHRIGSNADVVLIPQPTSDPDDPLNWSPLRKGYHFWLLIIWGILMSASVNWSGPVWVPLQYDLNTTVDALNISAALCFAFLAIGCILLQPTAMKIGRRPVYILGTFLNVVGCLMGGFQRSVEVYYVVNILTGFGAAPVDSLVQISTTDLFFAHERGTRLSLIALALGTGSYMGPVAAGYITEAQGWRFCFWYLIIFFGIILVLQIFTLEESIYMRPLADPEPHYEPNKGGSKDNGLTGDNPSPLIAQPIRRDTVTTDSTFPIPAQTYWQKMAPIHTQNANPKKWWWLAIFPFRLLTFPAIMWVGIMVGIQIMWLSLLSVTQSELFSVPPYSFGIAVVGDTNIAAFVGGIFGMCWGGPLSDWYILRRSRQNKGIMEPEFRLWLLIVPTILNSAGLLMYGLGAYNGSSWVISAGVGTAFIGFGIGSGGAICLTYAIDAYPGIAAESMVLILFIRNVIGFAFTFAIQPWIDGLGGQVTTIMLAVLCLVSMTSFLIMVRWGKNFRRRTAKKYLHYTEQRARRA
ncbi:major facilitator superfamily domain-containing protein [Hyaloscypha sp. PMI_1271]|nr:major facilitator superfamily domain-containing protein [Hyaloscypha sp. PMI_1271]